MINQAPAQQQPNANQPDVYDFSDAAIEECINGPPKSMPFNRPNKKSRMLQDHNDQVKLEKVGQLLKDNWSHFQIYKFSKKYGKVVRNDDYIKPDVFI